MTSRFLSLAFVVASLSVVLVGCSKPEEPAPTVAPPAPTASPAKAAGGGGGMPPPAPSGLDPTK